MSLVLARTLTVGGVAWVLLVLSAPAALGTEGLSGPAAYLYAGASSICHQLTERSFTLAAVQLPVCARCFGLYLSGATGAVVAWFTVPRDLPRARLAVAVAAVPTGLTWALEAAGVAGFSNVSRGLAALPLGAACGWVFVQMLRYDAESDGREIHHSRTPARLG
jgi:uncharacterized membrane protein